MTHHPIDPARGSCDWNWEKTLSENTHEKKLADARLDMFQREHEQRLAAEADRDEAQRALAEKTESARSTPREY